MTIDLAPPCTHPWTPRVAAQLTALAAAAFVYVTAEVLPVGALPAIAADLQVSEALIGTLLAGYALVAAVTTVPLVRLTARWPRRRTLMLALTCLTVSQLVSALAPTFAVLVGGRVLCALTHGLMWSVIAPIGARLMPAGHAGRSTTAVYAGTALALVVGNPLTAAMSELWGWRVAVVVVTVAAAAVTTAAATTLPMMPVDGTAGSRRRPRRHRNPRLRALSVLTLVGVTGHFICYTFIVVLIRDVVGVGGSEPAWLLTAFGVAGLLSMSVMAGPLDRKPKQSVVGCLAVLAAAFAVLSVLSVLAAGGRAGPLTMVVGTAAIVVWGASSTALPPMMQAVAMDAAPHDPDGASGQYVASFQVGIMAGAMCGALLYQYAGLAAMTAASSVLVGAVLCRVVVGRDLFGVPLVPGQK